MTVQVKGLRIGKRMRAVVVYVAAHPDCSKYEAAKAVCGDGKIREGYRAVDNAVNAGLVTAFDWRVRYGLRVSAGA